MPEKSLTQVNPELRELYKKGNAALQRNNLDYAIAIFEQVLQKEPAFWDCRQALRASQFKKVGGSTSFFKKMLGGASASPLLAKAQMSLRKNPLETVQTAEQVLRDDPSSSTAHKLLAEAALAADLPKTACLSLEIILKNSPKDYDIAVQYGQALARAGQVEKAESVYTDLMRTHPQKGEIAQFLKDLSARRTMSEGGYDGLAKGQGSYRDILKNKEEAVSLEQENRQVRSEDNSDNLIREYEARLVKEPGNVKLLRSVAELYIQKKSFDRALEFYDKIRSTDGGADPSLEKAIADTNIKKFDQVIEQLDRTSPDYEAEAARLQAQRMEYQLNDTKSRAERYPTDLQIRYDLGELYLKAGRIGEATAEFQKAQNNPSRRLQSIAYLGQCFAARGMNDMAARQFQIALKEKPGFDDQKKELIYHLGSVLEKMGKKEEAIEQFKLIYEVDISYKDVAEKVDRFYSGGG